MRTLVSSFGKIGCGVLISGKGAITGGLFR